MGAAYWYRGQTVEAEFEFKTALDLSTDLAEAHYNLAIFYETDGKYSRAADHFRKVLAIVPDFTPAKRRLERIEMRTRR
jgi:type IV pilus assembly protein PilF